MYVQGTYNINFTIYIYLYAEVTILYIIGGSRYININFILCLVNITKSHEILFYKHFLTAGRSSLFFLYTPAIYLFFIYIFFV